MQERLKSNRQPQTGAFGQENPLDVYEDARHHLSELVECCNERMAVQRQPVAEQYKHGRIALICDLAISASHNTTFRNGVSSHQKGIGSVWYASLVFDANTTNQGQFEDWEQKPMLVENVQIVQMPDGIVTSRVRLYNIHDEISDWLGGFLYQSTINGIYHCLAGFPDRKSGEVIVAAKSPVNYLVDSHIKSSLEVVECVPNDGRQIIRRDLNDLNLEQIVRSVRVWLDGDFVKATCGDLRDFRIQILDVMHGPLNLQLRSEEGGHRSCVYHQE